jgi:hypothetical protein
MNNRITVTGVCTNLHSTIGSSTIGTFNTNNNTDRNMLIDTSRLKHLLEIEKNYVHIIAKGVQTKIKSDKDNDRKIVKETMVLRDP